MNNKLIINNEELILVTGSNGFIGSRVVKTLLEYGFTNIRCFSRPNSNFDKLNNVTNKFKNVELEIFKGNLLSQEDCNKAVKNVRVILHLAAGIEKTFPGCYMNSAVTTRNLLESVKNEKNFKRIMSVSSFSVYSNQKLHRWSILNEKCPTEEKPEERYEPYMYGKMKQDELIVEYGQKYNIPYTIVRPGVVYGPGKNTISSRVGIDTFGIFLHLGGGNRIPFTYVDNCAEAMVLAGIVDGIDGEVFNIVDDNLMKSRKFLKLYKKNVKKFKSVYVPYILFLTFCFVWEKYSKKTKAQLPPVFNVRRCSSYWKGNRYSNKKIKNLLGWKQNTATKEAMKNYFEYAKNI